jgi:hypothetical protein
MGVMRMSHRFVGVFVFIYFAADLLFRAPFPPKPWTMTTLALMLFFIGFEISDRDERRSMPMATQKAAKFRSILDFFLLGVFVGAILLELSKSDMVNGHPIDNLTFEANVQHNHWVKQATESRSLQDAVSRYKERYHTYPPP